MSEDRFVYGTPAMKVSQVVKENLPGYLRLPMDAESDRQDELLPRTSEILRSQSTEASLIRSRMALDGFPREVQRRILDEIARQFPKGIPADDPSAKQRITRQVVDSVAADYKRSMPVLGDALNKKTLDAVKEQIYQAPLTDAEAGQTFVQHYERALEAIGVKEKFTQDELETELEKVRSELVSQQSLQSRTATEVIRQRLHNTAMKHGVNYFDQSGRDLVDEQAQQLSVSGEYYRETSRDSIPKEKTQPLLMAADPLSGLGLGKGTKTPGYASRYYMGKMSQNVVSGREELIGELNKHPELLRKATGRSRIIGDEKEELQGIFGVYDGASLQYLASGYSADDIRRKRERISRMPFGWGLKEDDPYYKELLRLEDKLKLIEMVDPNGTLMPWYMRRQRALGGVGRKIESTAPYVLVDKWKFFKNEFKLRSIDNPWLNPMRGFDRRMAGIYSVIDKINPFALVRAHVSDPIKHWAGRKMLGWGSSMMAKAAVSAGAKKVLLKLGGKALLKLGGAALGLGTGGVGTVIMLASLAKDLWQNKGVLWDLIKKLALVAVAVAAIIWGLMLAMFKVVASAIFAGMMAWGLLTANPILFGLGAAGFAVTNWGAITSFFSSSFSSMSAALASFGSGLSAWWTSVLAAGSQAVATVGLVTAGTFVGVGGGALIHQAIINEAHTLRVAGTMAVVPIDGICWPTTGIITQLPNPNHLTTNSSGQAIDIAHPDGESGTPVYAVLAGAASADTGGGGYGNYVTIVSPEGVLIYAHLSGLANGIEVYPQSTPVQQNQIIGYMGSTGNSTGAHLHYEALENDIRMYIPTIPPLALNKEIDDLNRCQLNSDVGGEDENDEE